uniref:DNA-binding protein BIN4 n=1 Tax=Kalanchoe fedtschenkoi TaxID=63787 RepID=A0A7N0UQX0_KALFE
MTSSREDSPDWLRSFQPPDHSVVTLSSDSESSHRGQSPSEEDLPDLKKTVKGKRDAAQTSNKGLSQQHSKPLPTIDLTRTRTVSSDSESFTPSSPETEDSSFDGDLSSPKTTRKEKDIFPVSKNEGSVPKDVQSKKSTKNSPLKRLEAGKLSKEDEEPITNMKGEDPSIPVDVEMLTEPLVCSTTMPLVLPDKVHRTKVLVECEGDSIDMSGDMGAVGRAMISDAPFGHEMCLDLKGTMYKTTVVPSRTFCVVNFGQSEAKIEAIMNDFIQLKPQSNVFHAETMVEGTLDGFSFDSEDEAERVQKLTTTENDEDYDAKQVNGKRKGKAEKNLGKAQKKGRTAGGKPQKKVRKKPQAAKKAKNKK